MNRLQLLLCKLSEEASKVSQIAMKTQQFGLDSSNPSTKITNAKYIHSNLDNLAAIVEMLNEEFDLEYVSSPVLIKLKKNKVNKYAEYSKDLNLLGND